MTTDVVLSTLFLILTVLCGAEDLNGQCSRDSCDMNFRVILAGATGETGRLVLDNLLKDKRIAKVTTLGRRESAVQHEKLDHKVVDFENLPGDAFPDHDVAICTLGTTRGKSGAKGFVKVDRDYVLDFASKSKAAGIQQFHMMSSQGANPDSYVLYTQVKGEVDKKIQEMEFERTAIYRPAVLLVKRQEQRLLESAAIWLFGWADRGRSYSIPIENVADAMVGSIFDSTSGIVDNHSIIEKAKLYRQTES